MPPDLVHTTFVERIHAMITAQLFFGGNIPDAGSISNAMFSSFVDDVIVPRFDGFTITKGKGYWKGESETVYILTIILTEVADEDLNKIEEIGKIYKKQFRQEAVFTNIVNSLPQLIV